MVRKHTSISDLLLVEAVQQLYLDLLEISKSLKKPKSMLSFESALTDILATIVAFILFEAVISGNNLIFNTLARNHWEGQ